MAITVVAGHETEFAAQQEAARAARATLGGGTPSPGRAAAREARISYTDPSKLFQFAGETYTEAEIKGIPTPTVTPAQTVGTGVSPLEQLYQMSSAELATRDPTMQERQQVSMTTGYTWDPWRRTWKAPIGYARIMAEQRAAVRYSPAPSVYRDYAAQREYEAERRIQTRAKELGELARKEPAKYWGMYATSAWAAGPISGAGIGARTLARPVLEPSLKEARRRELRAFAERTLRIERDPARYVGRGMIEAPVAVGTGWALGAVGSGLAFTAPKAGAVFSLGVKAVGLGLTGLHVAPSFIKGEYVETVGRLAEVGAAGVFAYTGYKGAVEEVVERRYPSLIAKGEKLARLEKEIVIAKEAGKLVKAERRTLKSVIKEMPSMRGKKGEIIYEYISSRRGDIIVGGSGAERTQITGKIPRDIDIYVRGDVKAIQQSLYRTLKKGGVQVTKGRGGKILYKGKTLVDIHTAEHLQSQVFFRGTAKTMEGIEVMDVKGQFLRKAVGKFEPGQWGRRAKDVPAFESLVKRVIITGKVKAEKGFPLLKPYRKARVGGLEQMFKEMGRKGYAEYPKKPEIPAVSILPTFYKKTEKAPQIPKYTVVSKPLKSIGYPAVARVRKEDYLVMKPPKVPKEPPYLKPPKRKEPPYLEPPKVPKEPPYLKPPSRKVPPYSEPPSRPPKVPPYLKPPSRPRPQFTYVPGTQPRRQVRRRVSAPSRPRMIGRRGKKRVFVIRPRADYPSLTFEELRTGRKAKHPPATRIITSAFIREMQQPSAAAFRFPTAGELKRSMKGQTTRPGKTKTRKRKSRFI